RAGVAEPPGTFGNRFFSSIEIGDKPAAKLLHLREGVRLASLVAYDERGSFLDFDNVRLEVPVRIRSSRGCLCEQLVKRRRGPQRDVLAEIRPNSGIKSGRIAFVQGHDLYRNQWSRWICRLLLSKRLRHANERTTGSK